MKKVTFLRSNTFKMYLSILLLVFAVAYGLHVTSALLLLAVGWYANKTVGALE